MTLSILPQGKSTFFYPNGSPLANGSVGFYQPGTLTPLTTYADNAGVTPNANPLSLDANGQAVVWATGTFRQIVKDVNGNTIWDQIISDPTVALKSDLSAPSGAGLSGINLLMAYQVGTIGATLVPVPNGDNTGTTDCSSAFNSALQAKALSGGGVLKPIPGTYKINGSVLIPSNIVLDLTGVTLTGNGSNTILKSGAIISGVLTDITTEWGTSDTGNGTHAVFGSTILNGTLTNAALGVRGHRLNFGCSLNGVFFANTLTQSWDTTHSWGLEITKCTVYAPAVCRDFVDWTEIHNNSFEGSGSTNNTVGLTIGGTWGGSYSANIHSNGFHHLTTAITFACEAANTIIESNHFEDCMYHVTGGSLQVSKLRIKNNWMKANLATPANTVIPIDFQNIVFSEIGPNNFITDGSSGYSALVIMNTTNCIGNKIYVDYSVASLPDLTMYQIGVANTIELVGGSNNSSVAQPFKETWAGSSGLTSEKYHSRYNAVANSIPFCTTTYSGTTITIDTFIPCTAYGTTQLCAFNLKINGSTTYIMAGTLARFTVSYTVNIGFFGGETGLTMTLSNNGGFLRLTIIGAPSGGNVTGWIKEL
ncbi:hypothetical protein [Tolumonas lignilytica]|uniref:hypothetical protein n=1 Tax=Tolumonas lignilytica TaxID=1283284 RepID=UPI0004667343|nr:hypothetical protein [Tolumonas lignilytica]